MNIVRVDKGCVNKMGEENKKNNSKIVLFAVVVLSVLVICLGGYIIYDKLLDKPQNNNDNTTTTTTTTAKAEVQIVSDVDILLDKAKNIIAASSLSSNWKEEKFANTSKVHKLLEPLEENFSDFLKEFETMFNEDVNCSSDSLKFNLKDNTLKYETKIGYNQTIENIKKFKYFTDESEFYIYLITNDGSIWEYHFFYNVDECKYNQENVPKFEKMKEKYQDVYLYHYSESRDYFTVFADNNGNYYDKDGNKVNPNLIYKKRDCILELDFDGNMYLKGEKLSTKYKYMFEEYAGFGGLFETLYFIIDEDNYLYYVDSELGLIKYPSKVEKVYYGNIDENEIPGYKFTFENGKDLAYYYEYDEYIYTR